MLRNYFIAIWEEQLGDKSITSQFFWVLVSEPSEGILYLIIIMRKTSKPISCEILSENFSESDSQQFESYQITGLHLVVFLVVTIWIPVTAGRDNYLTWLTHQYARLTWTLSLLSATSSHSPHSPSLPSLPSLPCHRNSGNQENDSSREVVFFCVQIWDQT